MANKEFDNIFIARCERTVHPDLTCDKCKQQFEIGVKEKAQDWEVYAHPLLDENNEKYKHLFSLCPRLIKLVVKHNGRILCPKCLDGVLLITKESKFSPPALFFTFNGTWSE